MQVFDFPVKESGCRMHAQSRMTLPTKWYFATEKVVRAERRSQGSLYNTVRAKWGRTVTFLN